MKTIIGYEKVNGFTFQAIYKKLDNSPCVRHYYENDKLWVSGIGNMYTDRKECLKKRVKRFETLHKFEFFGKTFYGNVPRWNFRNVINNANGFNK